MMSDDPILQMRSRSRQSRPLIFVWIQVEWVIFPIRFSVPSTFRGVIGIRSLWRRMWCFFAYRGCMKSPPAPVSSRTEVSTVLFSFSVLHVMGMVMVKDLFPKSATSTEERISVLNVEVERSPKNPHRSSCSRIVCPSPLSPCLPLNCVSSLVRCSPSSFLRIWPKPFLR